MDVYIKGIKIGKYNKSAYIDYKFEFIVTDFICKNRHPLFVKLRSWNGTWWLGIQFLRDSIRL